MFGTSDGADFERLVCARLDDLMVSRGFDAGHSSGGTGSVISCVPQDELHARYPEVVDDPEHPAACFDVTIAGSTTTGVSSADLEHGTFGETLDRLGHTELAGQVGTLGTLPLDDALDVLVRAIETLLP